MSTNKQALLIENGQLVADTLRHLADNEIDSDYFAIMSTSENGTEIEHELAITDYALQAAGTVDELVKALEAAEKRIAELEAREVKMPELKMLSDYLREVTFREREDILLGVKLEFHRNLKAAGISVKGE